MSDGTAPTRPRRRSPHHLVSHVWRDVRNHEVTSVDHEPVRLTAPSAADDAFDSPLSLARGLYWLARGQHPEAAAIRLARVGFLRARDIPQAEIARTLGCRERTVRRHEAKLRALLEATDDLPLPRPIPVSARRTR